MTNRVLDWVSRHDPKSKGFGVSAVVENLTPRRAYWNEGAVLDQGSEGACVGFGWTAELLASPRPSAANISVAENFALQVYREAKKIDEWSGEDYSGTSVLAGAKVVQSKGFMDSYRWCFGVEQVRDAIIGVGPVVIGIPWYEGMYETRPSGLVQVTGRKAGGHCITLTGYHPSARLIGEDWKTRFDVFRWRNSWGPDYARNGSGYIRIEDLAKLLDDDGEACVPVGRKRVQIVNS